MPHGFAVSARKMRNPARNSAFSAQKNGKTARICDLLRGKCQMPHGFCGFRTEKAKSCTEFGIFRAEKAKSCEEFWIFCAERAKFRSGFPILSLAGAKSPSHEFQPAARFPKFEGGTVICR